MFVSCNQLFLLFCCHRKVLESSLEQTKQLIDSLESASVPLKPHVRLDHEPAPCCEQCSEEVFNILFVLSHKGKYLVYCHHCAKLLDKACIVLKQVSSMYT